MTPDIPAEEAARTMAAPAGDLANWLLLAKEMIAVGEALSAVARADRSSGPQVVGLALLARSLGHMQAVALLIQASRIVEARVITRNLLENLFLAVALGEDGSGTFRKLEDDHRGSRFRRGRLITRDTSSFSPEQIAQVAAHMQRMGNGQMLKPSEIAKHKTVAQAYLLYAKLSADSAHASLDSLERYLVTDEGGSLIELSLEVYTDSEESRDTVVYACMALLRIFIAIRDLTGATKATQEIEALSNRYIALTETLATASA